MKTKIILALGIISGIEPAYDKWEDFCGDIEKPPIDHYKESLFGYKDRIGKIVKKEAVDYLGKLLGNIVK
jgi:hypothetical protein